MQSVALYASSAVFVLLTLAASTYCDTELPPVADASVRPVVNNDTAPAQVQSLTEASVQNDQPKTDPPVTSAPTRLPPSDAASLTPQPGLVHETSKSATTPRTTVTTMNTTASMGAKTDKKNGSSRVGPELLVTTLIALILSAAYA